MDIERSQEATILQEIKRTWKDESMQYQCKESSHVSSLDLNLRFRSNCRWIELMSVVDVPVTVRDRHFYWWCERIKNISYHSSNNKRFYYSCHWDREKKRYRWGLPKRYDQYRVIYWAMILKRPIFIVSEQLLSASYSCQFWFMYRSPYMVDLWCKLSILIYAYKKQ